MEKRKGRREREEREERKEKREERGERECLFIESTSTADDQSDGPGVEVHKVLFAASLPRYGKHSRADVPRSRVRDDAKVSELCVHVRAWLQLGHTRRRRLVRDIEVLRFDHQVGL